MKNLHEEIGDVLWNIEAVLPVLDRKQIQESIVFKTEKTLNRIKKGNE